MQPARQDDMTYVITQKCVGTCDTACVDVCPCDCILGPVPLEPPRRLPANERASQLPGIQMFIDPEVCIDDGACEAEGQVAAIFLEDDVPEEQLGDNESSERFFQ